MFDPSQNGYQHIDSDNIWIPNTQRPSFTYSDGEAFEKSLLEIMRAASDVSIFSTDLISKIVDWPTLYHLTSRRSNLLRPIIEHCSGPVLEVGAGCGAITRFLGESSIETVALEGSTNRARVAAARCRGLDNVKVVVDNIQVFNPGPIFQTVVVVGVLEYARVFFDADSASDPIDTMLAKLREFLRPGGKIIIAIENQLGLKYFAGYPEDHLGIPMFGVEGRYGPKTPVTFGRVELREKLAAGGFIHQNWWFPFPDYKVPTFLLSESSLKGDSEVNFASLLSASSLGDPQKPITPFFSMQQAWPQVARNGLAGDLANSFLIIASDEEIEPENSIAFYFNNGDNRQKSFNKSLRFYLENDSLKVVRSQISDDEFAPQDMTSSCHDEVFRDGELWHDRLIWIVNQPCWSLTDILDWARVWWDLTTEKAGFPRNSPCELISGKLVDAIPRNLIVSRNDKFFIDQEWSLPVDIELGYLLYRSLLDSFINIETWAEPANKHIYTFKELILETSYGLGIWLSQNDLQRYDDFESQFQSRVLGKKLYGEHSAPYNLPIRLRPDWKETGKLSSQIHALRAEIGTLHVEIGSLYENAKYRSVHEAESNSRTRDLISELVVRESTTKSLKRDLDEERLKSQSIYSENLLLKTDYLALKDAMLATENNLIASRRNREEAFHENSLLKKDLLDLKSEIEYICNTNANLICENNKITYALKNEQQISSDLRNKFWKIKVAVNDESRTWISKLLRLPFKCINPKPLSDTKLIEGSGLFDADFYCRSKKGVKSKDALRDFIETGWKEGHSPNFMFDLLWYQKTYPDVMSARANPLIHYIKFGVAERRWPGPNFDPNWYLAQYRDVASSGCEPLYHYLHHGLAEGRMPRKNS